MIYGYARVSTDGQSVDAKVRALRGVGARQVFHKTASGANGDCSQLRRVLGQLDAGAIERRDRAEETLMESTRSYNVSHSTIARPAA